MARPDIDPLPVCHPLFEQATPDERRALLHIGSLQTAAAGELLFQDNDQYRGFYIVLQGTIKLYRTAYTGRQLVLCLVRDGGSFAEEPIFDLEAQKMLYHTTAETITEARLLFFPAKPFRCYLHQHPHLYRAMLVSLASSMQEIIDHFEVVSLYSVQRRLARYLATHAAPGSNGHTHRIVHLDVPKATLAAHLGTIPETISRAFQSLTRQGLIRPNGEGYYVTDPDQLHRLAQGRSLRPYEKS